MSYFHLICTILILTIELDLIIEHHQMCHAIIEAVRDYSPSLCYISLIKTSDIINRSQNYKFNGDVYICTSFHVLKSGMFFQNMWLNYWTVSSWRSIQIQVASKSLGSQSEFQRPCAPHTFILPRR
jgi:hypothetical protein